MDFYGISEDLENPKLGIGLITQNLLIYFTTASSLRKKYVKFGSWELERQY
jgi:hypothetical protein